MTIKELKNWIQGMKDEQEIFLALHTLDGNGIDIIICYDIDEEPCYNGECLQINITDKTDIQGTFKM